MTDSGRLLIVDDETPVLEVLSEYFGGQGYDVETASNGTEALDAVRRRRPDVVLLDIRMPGMDGVELLRRLRDLDAGLAVIMVTANEDVALARETLKLGAFDYVAKPFDFKYLDQAVAAGVMVAATATRATPEEPPPAPAPAEDPWAALAVRVFHAVRGMPDVARASTGTRLEDAALAAGRECAAGRSAAEPLLELERLVALAAALGDLSALARDSVAAALAAVRRTLPGR
jgi:two-component system response regulator (stage 0 sporulation protein F)